MFKKDIRDNELQHQVFFLIFPIKGVAVEIKGSVDHFHGHIRTQRGRKP